jgi:hypothetical protein
MLWHAVLTGISSFYPNLGSNTSQYLFGIFHILLHLLRYLYFADICLVLCKCMLNFSVMSFSVLMNIMDREIVFYQ